MVTSLGLEGFKCFKSLILPFAGLTLLTGFNGGGKSTTLQSILLLSRGLRECQEEDLLALNSQHVQLGTPREIFHHECDQVAFTLENEQCKVRWALSQREKEWGSVIGIDRLEVSEQNERIEYGRGDLSSLLLPLSNRHPHAHALVKEIRDTIFLSAVRNGAAELFPSPQIHAMAHADVGGHGEYGPWWFQRFMDEEVPAKRCHPGEISHYLRRQFQAWAGDMFPGVEANAVAMPEISLVRLELRMGSTEPWRRPANTGYGLSYAFPILVAGLLARPGQMLIIDSPEAHLHPQGQSRMGYFLAKMADAGVQIVLETHSDHILNGVRRAVRDGAISPQQVVAHFFNKVAGKSAKTVPVVSVHLDRQGNMSDGPNGFFDQVEKDLANIAGWG